MKKICLLLTFVFVMLLGVSALADMDVKELTDALAALKDLDADDLNGTQWDKVQAKITEVTEAIEKATTDNELNKAKADALAILETNTAEGLSLIHI